MITKKKQFIPEGWTLEEIKDLADFHDNQSEEDAIAEMANTSIVERTMITISGITCPKCETVFDVEWNFVLPGNRVKCRACNFEFELEKENASGLLDKLNKPIPSAKVEDLSKKK